MDPIFFTRAGSLRLDTVHGAYSGYDIVQMPSVTPEYALYRIACRDEPARAVEFSIASSVFAGVNLVGTVLAYTQRYWRTSTSHYDYYPLYCAKSGQTLEVAPEKLDNFGCERCPYELLCTTGSRPQVGAVVA